MNEETIPSGIRGVRRSIWLGSVGVVALVCLLWQESAPEQRVEIPADLPEMTTGATTTPSGPKFVALGFSPAPMEVSEAFDLEQPEAADIPRLIGQLSSGWAEERARAALLLGRLGTVAGEAIPTLMQIRKMDDVEDVRRAAEEAILNIRGYAAPPRDF